MRANSTAAILPAEDPETARTTGMDASLTLVSSSSNTVATPLGEWEIEPSLSHA